MSRSDLHSHACTIARAVAQIGDEWSLMIVRELFLGSRRFEDFLRLTGISSHLLSQRLKKLDAQGVIRQERYSDRPPRHEYHLTQKGRDLWPVIVALKQWGDQWLTDQATPVEIIHKTCGKIAKPQMTCSDCGEPMQAHDSEAKLSKTFQDERKTAKRTL